MGNNKRSKIKFKGLHPNNGESKIEIKFHQFSFTSIKIDGFSNFYKNSEEAHKKLSDIFGKIIPTIQGNRFSQIQNDSRYHFHKIDDLGQNKLYKRIIRELTKKEYPNMVPDDRDDYVNQYFFDSENIYQIGVQGVDCTRIVGILNDNIFEVIFFDIHHMIYPSKNYNEKDLLKYKYSPFLEKRVKK